ncbi:hypothetical protein [Arthrobacter sp. H14]|uniref:hypothetical protein n=1 Tax=Arthrobacter sp. H14 TaxID=1312959 RepID=UPI000478806D|nr:hypothetical protein [Arthrobacter sp. H14]
MGLLLFILLMLSIPAAVIFSLGWWAGGARQRSKSRRAAQLITSHPHTVAAGQAWRDGFTAGRNRTGRTRVAPAKTREAPVAPEQIASVTGPKTTPSKTPFPEQAPSHVRSPADGFRQIQGSGSAQPSRPARDPAAKEKTAEQRTLRNINITLYAAALLLISAASLSIGLAVPAAVKFIGLVLVAALFYTGGLVIHARSERLRPSATAFTGTGLALIPVTGLALHLLVVHDIPLAWFATSLIGTAAFIHAGSRLQSKVLAALALTFLVSTSWSGGAMVNQGVIWYFIMTMMLAAVSTFLVYRRPAWLANIYLKTFQAAHRFVVPATLAAAVVAAPILDSVDYLVLFTAATLYYAASTMAGSPDDRPLDLTAGRVTATLALAFGAYELGAGVDETIGIVGVLLALQAVLVSMLKASYGRLLEGPAGPQLPGWKRTTAESFIRTEIWCVGLTALALAVIGNGRLVQPDSPGLSDQANIWSSFNWALLLVIAAMGVVAFRERRQMAWLVLAGGLCALFEQAGPAPWRQAILLSLSVLATTVAMRFESRLNRAFLRMGVLVVLPLAGGSVASWAASGYFPDAAGTFPSDSAGNPLAAEQAGVAVLALLWLANVAGSAMALRRRAVHPRGAGARALLLPVGVTIGLGSALLLDRTERATGGAEGGGAEGLTGFIWVLPDWAELLTWTTLGVAVVSATLVLGRNGAKSSIHGHLNARIGNVRPWAHSAGLLGIAGAALLVEVNSADWAAELVLGIGVIYTGLRAVSDGSRSVRGSYAVAAQVCLVLGALQMLELFDADWHAGAAVFAVTLTAGQLARLYLDRSGRPLQGVAFRSVTGWAVLAALVLLPFGYAMVAGGTLFNLSVNASGADQAALLVQLSMLTVYGLAWWLSGAGVPSAGGAAGHGWRALPVAFAVVGLASVPSGVMGLRTGGWLPEPLWNRPAAAVILLVISAMVIAAEYFAGRSVGNSNEGPWLWARRAVNMAGSGPRAVSCALFIGAAVAVAPADEMGWHALILLIAAGGFVIFSMTTGIAALLIGCVIAVPGAFYAAATELFDLSGVPSLSQEAWVFPVSLAAAAVVLYVITAVVGRRFTTPRPDSEVAVKMLLGDAGPGWVWAHAAVLSGGSLAVLGFAAVSANVRGIDWLAYAGCLALAVSAAAAVLEWPQPWRELAAEVASIVVAGCIHRVWLLSAGSVDLFWQAQYWVVILALLASFEYFRQRSGRGDYVAIAGSALLSLSGLVPALFQDSVQTVWTLAGHAVLLVFGLQANRRLFVWWGAAGIGVAVLWYLRGYTFLLLAALAAGLIALAVWRLSRLRARSD